jgi:mRNA interferase HigB
MHVITRKRLNEFSARHPDAEGALDAWYRLMRLKHYDNPAELKADFPAASLLGGWRTVFNIGGNKYRLVVDVRYDLGRVYVREVLTHAEYTRRSRGDAL